MLRKLTILCENSVGKSVRAIGEHGFSCLVETDADTLLFDTGQGLGLVHNAALLGVDLASVSGIALSHGHFDHTGGLHMALQQSGPVPVYAHPQLFRRRYWVGKFERRENGIPFTREFLEEQGACFDLASGFRSLAPAVWLSGEIAHPDSSCSDPALQYPDANGHLQQDLLEDDACLVLESPRGPVVLLGCAHAGLARTLEHVANMGGYDQIHAVIGGMHLAPVDDEAFEQAVDALRSFRVQRIGVGHCTGQRRAADLYARFPAETLFLSVGSSLNF